ncbi:MAG: hypothetical protein KAR06_12180 [Deltaproteobacteria bacterium]|nr:hypothetical protein [Deltaproteobacteria bacterium]
MAKRAAAEPAETTSSPFRSSLAQDFDNAIANWIDCSPNANFGLGDEITISFWLKADAASIGYEKVVSRKNIWNSLTNWEVSMYDARPDLMLIYGSSGVATAQGPPGLDVTDWTYLTVTYSGTRVTFDANALPNALGTVAAIVDDTSWPLTLGMQAGHSDAQYRGLMDEVRLSLGAQSRDNHITDYRGMKDPAAHAKIDILM